MATFSDVILTTVCSEDIDPITLLLVLRLKVKSLITVGSLTFLQTWILKCCLSSTIAYCTLFFTTLYLSDLPLTLKNEGIQIPKNVAQQQSWIMQSLALKVIGVWLPHFALHIPEGRAALSVTAPLLFLWPPVPLTKRRRNSPLFRCSTARASAMRDCQSRLKDSSRLSQGIQCQDNTLTAGAAARASKRDCHSSCFIARAAAWSPADECG